MSTSRAALRFVSLSRSSVRVAISSVTNFLNLLNSSRRLSNASFHSLSVGGAAGGVGVAFPVGTGGVSDRLIAADGSFTEAGAEGGIWEGGWGEKDG